MAQAYYTNSAKDNDRTAEGRRGENTVLASSKSTLRPPPLSIWDKIEAKYGMPVPVPCPRLLPCQCPRGFRFEPRQLPVTYLVNIREVPGSSLISYQLPCQYPRGNRFEPHQLPVTLSMSARFQTVARVCWASPVCSSRLRACTAARYPVRALSFA